MYNTLCVPSNFHQVLEIAREQFPPGEDHAVAVDLVEPGKQALTGPWRQVVVQRSFQDAVPWILVTLWRGFTL